MKLKNMIPERPIEIAKLIEEFRMLQERNASPEAFQMWHAKVKEQYPDSAGELLKEVRRNLTLEPISA